MARKMVDVLVDGEVVVSYGIAVANLDGRPVPDADFVAEAKANLVEDDYGPEITSSATFIVRDVPPTV